MTKSQIINSYQPVLSRIAASLVSCRADAEDLVQETFLKWLSVDTKKIKNTKAYLVKALFNNALNHIAALKKKKEAYIDDLSWPDAVLKVKELDVSHLDKLVNMSAALNVLQSKLEPLERAVYLLREVFSFDYEELQEALKKKQDHCRQIFSRAKKKLRIDTQKIKATWPDPIGWKESFEKACNFGFLSELVRTLQQDMNLSSVLSKKK